MQKKKPKEFCLSLIFHFLSFFFLSFTFNKYLLFVVTRISTKQVKLYINLTLCLLSNPAGHVLLGDKNACVVETLKK